MGTQPLFGEIFFFDFSSQKAERTLENIVGQKN
jgi:hypothetical protein